MKSIKYIAYYSDPDLSKNRRTAPSADTKLDYIISALRLNGQDVSVVSKCCVGKCNRAIERHDGYITDKNGVSVQFLPDLTSKYRIVRFFTRWLIKFEIRKIVKKECLENDNKIIIYHSLGMYDIIKHLKKYKKSFTLEVEEIYSDVMTKRKKQSRKKEDFMFSVADSYVFSTELLNKEINVENKPYIICNGTYNVENLLVKEKMFNDGKIHAVYAGTLDPRKGGATAAAAAAAFLPDNYHIHILGFGSEKEIAFTKDHIEKISKSSVAKVSYDGLLVGDDYIKFIQSCDIGLSTQNPDAAFNDTSFPSKILMYMSNDLRVVSARIPVVETSDIGKYIYYYEHQSPEEIARAIMSVPLDIQYDSRQILDELNKKFCKELLELL